MGDVTTATIEDLNKDNVQVGVRALDDVSMDVEAGQITGLVIDEAQSLPIELLEEVRLLANIETATHKLLPLAGCNDHDRRRSAREVAVEPPNLDRADAEHLHRA